MAVEFKDYYKILGVDRKVDAKALRSAYRRLARKYHPDVAKGKDTVERFKEINEAYEVLSDPEKRQRRGGRPGGGIDDLLGGRPPGGGFDVGDLLGGGRARRGRAGREAGWDLQAGLEITLEEASSGTRKTFTMDVDGGRRDIDVKIPAGVRTGQRVRVAGEGGGDAGSRGDLYLNVTVLPHRLFQRDGDDIRLELPVSPPEAALGATVEVPTLRGKVSMKVPAGTSSGRTFRLPGYGMPSPKAGTTGDQLVQVKIVMPPRLTPQEIDLYTQLRALRTDSPRAGLEGG
jgi:curved DNA-binding protein